MMPQWITKKVIAWSLYDFADQAFSALFITFFFPILIKVHLGGNEFQIGLAMGLSVIVAALLVPVLGAISDTTGRRNPILIVAAVMTAGFAVLTGYIGLGPALLLAFFGNITHLASKDVYDAKMIDIAPPSRHGSLSGLGLSVGYIGAIVSLALAYPLLSYFGWESAAGIQAIFWQSGLWYILFSLPLFFLVPDTAYRVRIGVFQLVKHGFQRVSKTVANLPSHPVLARFLAASFFYNNAMNTVVVFLALFGRESIGLGVKEFFPVFALMALAAGIGSLLFGKLSDKFGPVRMIRACLFVWIAVIIFLIFVSSYVTFIAAGVLGGLVFGAIWGLNRHMIAVISPREKIAELFGFEGLTEKFSGVLGPVIFGYLAAFYGYTPALFSVLAFFIIGLALLKRPGQGTTPLDNAAPGPDVLDTKKA